MLDHDAWLAAVDGDNPSGADLRNDPRFHEIERLMQPRSDLVRDDQNNPVSQSVVPVDWSAILNEAKELSSSGRDVRLLVIVARASMQQTGLAGAAEGLRLIAKSCEQYWDTMHPALREGRAPAEAAMRRTNALMQLENASGGLFGDIEDKVLLDVRGLGPMTGRDIALASIDKATAVVEGPSGLSDKDKAEREEAHTQLISRVQTGCRAAADREPELIPGLSAAADELVAAVAELEKIVTEKLGAGSFTLPKLKKLSGRIAATFSKLAGSSGDADQENAQSGEDDVTNITATAPTGGAVSASQSPQNGRLPDRIDSRDDVTKCLDLVINFYKRTEPASPIPLIAERARRMVPMSFIELMEDLAPSGIKEFKTVAGVADARPTRGPSRNEDRGADKVGQDRKGSEK